MPGGEGGAPMPVSDTSNADRLRVELGVLLFPFAFVLALPYVPDQTSAYCGSLLTLLGSVESNAGGGDRGCRPTYGRHEQQINPASAILQSPWNKMNQTLTRILPFVIQLKYQGGIPSAFNLHHTILSSYFIVFAIYSFACLCCGGQILPSSMDDCCLPVLNATINLTGSLATTLLLMAIEPVFGWMVFVIWVMVCVKMTWGVRAQIYALLRLAIVNGISLLTSFFQADRVLPV